MLIGQIGWIPPSPPRRVRTHGYSIHYPQRRFPLSALHLPPSLPRFATVPPPTFSRSPAQQLIFCCENQFPKSRINPEAPGTPTKLTRAGGKWSRPSLSAAKKRLLLLLLLFAAGCTYTRDARFCTASGVPASAVFAYEDGAPRIEHRDGLERSSILAAFKDGGSKPTDKARERKNTRLAARLCTPRRFKQLRRA